MKHVFAVCAYKDSPYLDECLKSLRDQRVKSSVIICTSTPSDFISQAASEYGLRLFVRDGTSSLGDDWNYALRQAVTVMGASLVTIAHQDDVYEPDYLVALRTAFGLYPDMSVFCTRYRTIDAQGHDADSRAENVKRILRLGLRMRKLAHLRLIKRSALVFGNAICCPSCTYNVDMTGVDIFGNDDSFVTDWKALLRLAGKPGRFVLTERELVRYRIHLDAQTKKSIDSEIRSREEEQVYASLWPAPVARFLSLLMHASYGAYR